jgi:hypothetical protein
LRFVEYTGSRRGQPLDMAVGRVFQRESARSTTESIRSEKPRPIC